MKKRFSLIAVFAMLAVVLASCAGKYTIEFVEKDGTEIYEPIEVGAGKEIAMPAAPTKDGLTFDGWYEDPGFDVEFTDTVMPEESLVLYAKWVATLTFDSMGGTECNPITNRPGDFAQLPEPTKDGFVFAGWYQDQAYTTEQKNVIPAKHTTVYAKWQVKNGNTAYPFTNWRDNDGSAYEITKTEEGTTITATDKKGEWSFAYDLINIDATGYRVVELVVEGTKDCEAVIKLEGGDAKAIETRVKFTGEEQTITWVVKEAYITTTPGQKLMIFLNAGNKGFVKTPAAEGVEEVKFEEAPYVTIKSVGLYQPKDIEETSDIYAIHFDSNGGSTVESVFAKAGADVKTKASKKDGYTFAGWYTDKELTQAFDGKMPAQATILYAKWIVTVDMIKDTFTCGDKVEKVDAEKAIVYSYANGVLTVKKTAKAGDWTAMSSNEKGSILEGATKLTVVLTGTKDKQILVKVNDAYETWVTCTGAEQTVEIDLTGKTFNKDATALLLFPEGGKATEGAEFKISKIEFNTETPVDLASKGFACGDNMQPAIITTFTDGVLTVQKQANAGPWACVTSSLIGKDIFGAGKLVVTLKGPKDTQIFIKVNNLHEEKVTCTGELQTLVIDFSHITLNAKNTALVLMPEAGKEGEAITNAKFEISELYFIIESERVNDGYASSEFVAENAEKIVIDHSITKGVLTLVKNDNAGSYAAVKSVVMGDAIAQANELTITYNAPEGVQLLVKINDKGYMETWLTGTGKEETKVIPFGQYRINPTLPALLLFPEGGKEGADNITNSKIVISKLEFDNGVNLLANDYKIDGLYPSFTCGDNKIARNPIVQEPGDGVLTISKNAADAYAWSNVASYALGDTLTYTTLRLIVKGPKGEQLLVKINEQLEVMVTATGEQQIIDVDLSKLKVNKKAVALRLFPEPGKEGKDVKGSKFEISSILFSNYVALDTPMVSADLLGDTFTPLDADTYTITNADGKLTVKKDVEDQYKFVKSTLTGAAIEGTNRLYVTVKGTKDQELLVKINDQLEHRIVATGDVQTVCIPFDLSINTEKPAVLLVAGSGAAGKVDAFEITKLLFTSYADNVNVLGDTFVPLDADTYTITNADGKLTVKKDVEDQYKFVKSTLTGAAIVGTNRLYVTVKGTKDQELLVKINDQLEHRIVATGDVQTVCIPFDFEINAEKPAVLLVAGSGAAGKADAFEITRLEFAAVADPVNLVADTFTPLDKDAYTITSAEGKLTVKKEVEAQYSFVKSTLTGKDIVGYTKLTVTVKGTKGQELLVKINDKVEYRIVATGEVQTVVYSLLDLDVNESAPALLLVAGSGAAGKVDAFEITKLVFSN